MQNPHKQRSLALPGRRLLIVYDLHSQPFSIGDILTFQICSLILSSESSNCVIDFSFYANERNFLAADMAFLDINANNFYGHLGKIFEASFINQKLGSIFVFRRFDDVVDHVRTSQSDVWPPISDIKAGLGYMYYKIFDDVIYPHYLKVGSLPALNVNPAHVAWAQSFLEKHSKGFLPVSINIRNNLNHQVSRNLEVDVWLDFFHYCEKRYRIKFIVISSIEELFDGLDGCKNVVVSKNFGATLGHDAALMELCEFHMGAPSGLATKAIFSSKPYLFVKGELDKQNFTNSSIVCFEKDNIQRFSFSKPDQIFISGNENLQILTNYLERILNRHGM